MAERSLVKVIVKNNNLYLTTAASILITAALGIVAGLGLFMLAAILASLLIVTLFVVGLFEDSFWTS